MDTLRRQLRDSDAHAAKLQTRLTEADAHAQVRLVAPLESNRSFCLPHTLM